MAEKHLPRAIILAPLAGAWTCIAAGFATEAALGVLGLPNLFGGLPFSSWALLGVTFSIVGVFVTATLGLAWHAVAQRLRVVSTASYVTAGALIALLLFQCLIWAMGRGPTIYEDGVARSVQPRLQDYAGYACFGAAIAYFAWLIRRPDRDAPANPPTSPP